MGGGGGGWVHCDYNVSSAPFVSELRLLEWNLEIWAKMSRSRAWQYSNTLVGSNGPQLAMSLQRGTKSRMMVLPESLIRLQNTLFVSKTIYRSALRFAFFPHCFFNLHHLCNSSQTWFQIDSFKIKSIINYFNFCPEFLCE